MLRLGGCQRGWATAGPGRLLQLILQERVGNSIVVIDELEKAGRVMGTNGGSYAFHRRFVTLRRLAAILGLSWQSLRAVLKDAAAAPFAPDGEDIGAIFEWDMIEKVFCCRWPHQ